MENEEEKVLSFSDLEITITFHSSQTDIRALRILLKVIVTSLTKSLPKIVLIEEEAKGKSLPGKVLTTLISKFYLD